jgi:hypothetical protein
MNAGDILSRVPGLTREKLSYYVRAGFVKPKKIRRGELDYNEFSEEDLITISQAFELIRQYQTRPKAAFERSRKELRQMKLSFDRGKKGSRRGNKTRKRR